MPGWLLEFFILHLSVPLFMLLGLVGPPMIQWEVWYDWVHHAGFLVFCSCYTTLLYMERRALKQRRAWRRERAAELRSRGEPGLVSPSVAATVETNPCGETPLIEPDEAPAKSRWEMLREE